jgi:hypothetical protein
MKTALTKTEVKALTRKYIIRCKINYSNPLTELAEQFNY